METQNEGWFAKIKNIDNIKIGDWRTETKISRAIFEPSKQQSNYNLILQNVSVIFLNSNW